MSKLSEVDVRNFIAAYLLAIPIIFSVQTKTNECGESAAPIKIINYFKINSTRLLTIFSLLLEFRNEEMNSCLHSMFKTLVGECQRMPR
jgi:hypothetical protein